MYLIPLNSTYSYIYNNYLEKYYTHFNYNMLGIDYALGFNDEFYFSRFFKKQTSLSPKNYKIINKLN